MAYTFKRGEVYRGNLDPQKGSEQAGKRPVLIFQINQLNNPALTTIIIPFTSKLKYKICQAAFSFPKVKADWKRILLLSATKFE